MHKSARLRQWAITAVAFAATVVAACGGTSPSSGPTASGPGVTSSTIEIGINATQTGASGAACKPVSDSEQAWFDYVNSKGGINGRKIHTTVLDDGTQPPTAVANVKQFETVPVFAVFGGCGTGSATAIYPILNQDKVPYIFPQASLDKLNTPFQKYVFIIQPLYGPQDATFIDTAFKQYGTGSLYFVVQKIPGYDALITDAQKQVESRGGKFAGSSAINSGSPDFTPDVLKLAAAKPDYVMILASAPDEARIVNTMVAQHALPTKRIFGPNLNGEQFTSNVDASVGAANIVSAMSPTVLPGSADAAECEKALKAASPAITSQSFTLLGCGQAQVFTEALKRAGTGLTRDGVIKALENINNERVSPALPSLTFGANNRYGLASMFWLDLKGRNLTLVKQVKLVS